jgi:hypothetical protein
VNRYIVKNGCLGARFYLLGEFVEEGDLCGVDDGAGCFEGIPGTLVDFGESLRPARTGGPFKVEGVADEFFRVEVAGDRPGIDAFAAFLANGVERFEVSLEVDAGLFVEFADGGVEGGFVSGDLAFGDGPGAGVFVLPEGASGVDEEDFEVRVLPVEEDAGGLLRIHMVFWEQIASQI